MITRSQHIDEGHRKQWASQLYFVHTFLHTHGAVEHNILIVDAGKTRFVKGFSKRALRAINRQMRLKDQPPFPPVTGADDRATAALSGGGAGGGRDVQPSGSPAAPAAGGVRSGMEMPPGSSDTRLPDEDLRGVDSLDGSSTGGSCISKTRGSSGSASSGSACGLLATDSNDSDASGSGSESVESTRSRGTGRGRAARAPRGRKAGVAARGRVPAAIVPLETAPRALKRSRRR